MAQWISRTNQLINEVVPLRSDVSQVQATLDAHVAIFGE
jgi:hypothetical protein